MLVHVKQVLNMITKAEGIVIRSIDYGEGNKILTVWTKEYGKISLMARGARKMKSSLSSVAQLFTYAHYSFFMGSKGMGTLSQGETLQSFRGLREDLMQTAYAAYFVELVDKITHDREPDAYLYKLLLTTLTYIQDKKDPEVLARLFELKLLIIAGYKPVLDACVLCGQTEGRFGFSVREGGFLCADCFSRDLEVLSVQPITLKLLRLLYHFDIDRLGEISVKPPVKAELQNVLWQFMDYHTPLRLKARSFLEKMDKFDSN